MSAIDAAVAAGAATGAAVSLVTIWKFARPSWRARRERGEQLTHLLRGKAAIHDEQGNVIEPGYGAIGYQVGELDKLIRHELTPNGGSSLVDRMRQIGEDLTERLTTLAEGHATLVERQNEIRVAVEAETARIEDARRLAGEAAATAARVEQRHRDDVGRIDAAVTSIDEKVEDLRQVTLERLDDAELKAEAMRAIAHELGMPLPGE